MCGVVVYVSKSERLEDRDLLERLFTESKIRGLHAFGYSMLFGKEIKTFKSESLAALLFEFRKDFLIGPKALVFHTRYSTSGDWLDAKNNQPIDLGSAVLAFNGVVSQAPKKHYEAQYKTQYTTENDGEIVLRKFLDGEDPVKFVQGSSFSFSGAILTADELLVFRNENRPLWRCATRSATIFASTKDILERSIRLEDEVLEIRNFAPVGSERFSFAI